MIDMSCQLSKLCVVLQQLFLLGSFFVLKGKLAIAKIKRNLVNYNRSSRKQQLFEKKNLVRRIDTIQTMVCTRQCGRWTRKFQSLNRITKMTVINNKRNHQELISKLDNIRNKFLGGFVCKKCLVFRTE